MDITPVIPLIGTGLAGWISCSANQESIRKIRDAYKTQGMDWQPRLITFNQWGYLSPQASDSPTVAKAKVEQIGKLKMNGWRASAMFVGSIVLMFLCQFLAK